MIFNFEERLSDSPLVEVIWRNHSERGGPFISIALSHWQMAFTRHEGKLRVTVRGPETHASPAYCPPEAEDFGIIFKHGVVMLPLPASRLRDGMADLPGSRSGTFWLNGSTWQVPDYENVDTFIDWLARAGLLVKEPVVDLALKTGRAELSERSVQRRFLSATGLTRGALAQIDRARRAVFLLQSGVSILDTVEQAGYSDQPHLTRSLKHYVGLTPAQLLQNRASIQLSFLSHQNQR